MAPSTQHVFRVERRNVHLVQTQLGEVGDLHRCRRCAALFESKHDELPDHPPPCPGPPA